MSTKRAGRYRWVWERAVDANLQSGPQMLEYEAIADRIARDETGRVLDWGCGWGQVSALLVERGVDVASFDWRPDAPEEEVPLERFPHLTAFASAQPVALPYPDGAFDAVLSCGVLEHVHDPDGSLEEIKRVLVPAGRLYVFKLPNRRSYLEAIARAMGAYHHGKLPNDVVYTLASARELLARHGYAIEELRLENVLPLTLPGGWATPRAREVWTLNQRLSRVPILNRIATNVTAVARAPGRDENQLAARVRSASTSRS
jgi:SAM-dependent methyltransferase